MRRWARTRARTHARTTAAAKAARERVVGELKSLKEACAPLSRVVDAPELVQRMRANKDFHMCAFLRRVGARRALSLRRSARAD